MLNINFKDYFWGKCDDLHERYNQKKITISNLIELFTRLQTSMSNFSKELNSIITKDYILYPEKNTSKYDAMESIKYILTIQSTQLNVGIEIIKKRILETIKIEKEEEMLEKELYNDLKKNINKYEESKLNLSKIKEKFYQSAKSAEMAIYQAKEFALKEKEKKDNVNNDSNKNLSLRKSSSNNIMPKNLRKSSTNNIMPNNSRKSSSNNIMPTNDNNEALIKLEQKSLDNLLEARKNDEKYSEILKETNNYREIVNQKQNDLLKFFENIENKDHQLYTFILKDYCSYLLTNNSIMKGNIIQMEDKINKIDYNTDIIALINIYGSEKKPEKIIKYIPYKLDFENVNDNNSSIDDNKLTLNYHIVMSMKPFIKDLCPNFDIELETKKQEMRDLLQKILDNNDNTIFTKNDKEKLLCYISEEWGKKGFLLFLSKMRTTGKFCRDEEIVQNLAEILKKILFFAEQNEDYDSAKNCIILSQTYYYEDKNTSKKIYLVELISDNKWLKKPEFWKNIIDVMIKEDIERLKGNKNNEKINQKEEKQSIDNIVFGQVICYIKNMRDFKFENKIILKIVDEFLDKYKIGNQLSKNIYDNIANENEIEKLRKEYKNDDNNNIK